MLEGCNSICSFGSIRLFYMIYVFTETYDVTCKENDALSFLAGPG